MGLYLLHVIGARITSNRFTGTGHGVEWWGGDSADLQPVNPESLVAGKFTITGNECYRVAGACVWGSKGALIKRHRQFKSWQRRPWF